MADDVRPAAMVAPDLACDAEDRRALALGLAERHALIAIEALQAVPPWVSDAICVAWLDRAGPPPPAFLIDLHSEADGWAAGASSAELRAYGLAVLRRLGGSVLLEVWRKRLLVTLWEGCPAEWRQAFLRRVDPEGRYRGRELRGGRRAA